MPQSPFLLTLAAILAAAQASSQQAPQKPTIDAVLNQLDGVRSLSGVTISPDGNWITWLQGTEDRHHSEIFLLEWKNVSAKPRRLDPGGAKKQAAENGVSWSPDSTQIAFLSDAASPGQQQVFVVDRGGAKPRKLTNVKGYLTDLRWSNDGKRLAFLFAENGGGGGPLQPAAVQTGVIGADLHNQRVAIIDVADANLRQVSPADLNIYEYDWSPDGQRIAAIAAPGPADNNWWVAKLYTLDLDSGKMNMLYTPPSDRQIAIPRWSPDGSRIAFLGGLMSDEGFDGGEIYLLPSRGGEIRDLTPNVKTSPTGFCWRGKDKIVLTEAVDGGSAIADLDVRSGQIEMRWKGGEGVHEDGNFPNFALAADGKTSAAIRSDWRHAPELYAGPIGSWIAVTSVNDSQRPHWGKAESLVWNSDGYRAQGWLVYPENFDPSKRYPMVVEIHGGPAGVRTASWPNDHFDMSVMAGLGYFVFFPNPRGSYGEGETFTHGNVKDFGGGDLRDVLAGVDQVLKLAPVDESRIGVTGWSYGGFMTMWTVTQTHRFRAAVAGAGIANWQSYYGENLIDQWMIPYFGASVYDDPAVYAKSSPIEFIKQVRTPTLIIVGERDAECPAPQSFEFWHALHALHVPTELVVYEGEGHSFNKPEDRADVLKRTLAWFDRYLNGSGS